MESPALDAYLKQVEMYLPPWKSKEILKEIRSHILDQAEGLAAEKGVEVDEGILKEVIHKLGPAERFASGYVPPVTLIRPEYTMPFLLYSGIAVALSILLGLFAGPAVWIANSIFLVGLLFVFFLLLSRSTRVFRLPLWHPGIEKIHATVGRGLHQAVSHIGSGMEKAFHKQGSSAWTTSPPEAPTSPPAQQPWPQPGFWVRSIARSGPRALRIHEIVGASIRFVFGLALACFVLLAASPIKILGLTFDSPSDGFHLLITAPGLDANRAFLVLCCFATALSGLVSLFLGISRGSLVTAVFSKIVWAALLFALFFAEQPFLAVDFQSAHPGAMRDWAEAKQLLPTGISIFLLILIVFHLLATAYKVARYGMLEAWYRRGELGTGPSGN